MNGLRAVEKQLLHYQLSSKTTKQADIKSFFKPAERTVEAVEETAPQVVDIDLESFHESDANNNSSVASEVVVAPPGMTTNAIFLPAAGCV